MDSFSSRKQQDLRNQQKANNDVSASKRRKVDQKSVVAVRIEAIGSVGKQKGEGPPSDLWSWRKYGQKPIKGSPYPRGYYRCSTSKGCSAKKQVERCKIDASMLVITYTSDHNHPTPDPLKTTKSTTWGKEEENMISLKFPENTDMTSDQQQTLPVTKEAEDQEGKIHQEQVDICMNFSQSKPSSSSSLSLSSSSSSSSSSYEEEEENDFFDELEELPSIPSSSASTSLMRSNYNFFDERVLLFPSSQTAILDIYFGC